MRMVSKLGMALMVTGALALAAQAQAPEGAPPDGAAAIVDAGDVARGAELVEGVAMCGECHSQRDARGEIIPGTRYRGGALPVEPAWARDWPSRVPRIAGLPGYSDEQALRLLTEGAIGRDGTRLRAPMPRYRMTPQDAADVIAYLRSL